jgi:sugar-specific transcriptional regulator TrmB
MDESGLREELSVFGLSDTEIDTYLAVLSKGEASTRVIAEDAGVTQRAVYDIAERLETRGLVRVKEHASPTMIRALPPGEAIANLSERLEALAPSLEDRFNETTEEAPEIQIIRSRDTALKRLRSAIDGAELGLFLAIPHAIYPAVESELRAAVDRGVLVFLLLGEFDVETLDAGEFEGVADAVRYWHAALPFLYVVDDDSAMIGDSDLLLRQNSDEEAVTVSQEHLTGSILGMYLSAYWSTATELYVTEPDPLPGTYDWFRAAVLHAYLHHQQGTELWVEATSVDGDEVFGRVKEVRQALVEPSTNGYTLEMCLVLETRDGEVTFGGPGAFIEDYEAESVTLKTSP